MNHSLKKDLEDAGKRVEELEKSQKRNKDFF